MNKFEERMREAEGGTFCEMMRVGMLERKRKAKESHGFEKEKGEVDLWISAREDGATSFLQLPG